MMKIFGGLEGGASFSKVVLMQEDGRVLASVEEGPSTNYLLVGMDECLKRINSMVEQSKRLANLDLNIPLETLGLCMSGCEDIRDHERLKKLLVERFPQLTKCCAIASDTVGSLLTASPRGGIVLIAGTGSNSLLFNPDSTSLRCGGWGHLIGDYGSAFWVAQRAVRLVIEADENFNPTKHDTRRAKEAIFNYFNITDHLELLKPMYVNFNKTQFAGLTLHLAKLAIEEDDALCKQIFNEAGDYLAKHVLALLPRVDPELVKSDGGLKIVCVGSIFKSWNLLKNGFFTVLGGQLREFTLFRLTKSSSIGAAFFGAKQAQVELPIDFQNNCQVLCHFKYT